MILTMSFACACGRTGFTVDDIGVDAPIYRIFKAKVLPEIDGNLSEFMAIPALHIASESTGASGSYRLLWDDEALYVGAEVRDSFLNASLTSRDDRLWYEDSLEIMFDTGFDRAGYVLGDDFKFFINLLNTQCDQRADDWDLWSMSFDSEVVLDGSNNDNTDEDVGYSVEVRIPWDEWEMSPPDHGVIWGVEVSLNDKTPDGTFQTPWANTNGGEFHPDGWGIAVFTERH
jgi:endo-1,4-beta-xylanase